MEKCDARAYALMLMDMQMESEWTQNCYVPSSKLNSVHLLNGIWTEEGPQSDLMVQKQVHRFSGIVAVKSDIFA